ncbi:MULTISPECIES: hypothetical protein [unclassified Paenibacillus]|uniref:hypothetical protein n=1 Tax=unclassified Paenibacillus TaxID=185978 RepID=UPI002473D3F4|nr:MULTISPECIES: hypothetical protein [unclassified Paenibacillus]
MHTDLKTSVHELRHATSSSETSEYRICVANRDELGELLLALRVQPSATLARQAVLVFAKQTEGSLASQSRRRMQPGGGAP